MSTSQKLKVIVVGAGFGGLGAAIELADRGYDVTVLEKYADSNSQGGELQPKTKVSLFSKIHQQN